MSLEISSTGSANLEDHPTVSPPPSASGPGARIWERPRKNKPRKVLAEERKRSVKGCDRCRKLKKKCEGGVPCRRCLYYSNTCEFNRLDSHEQDESVRSGRSQISKAHISELARRCFYMERILRARCPDIRLDTESLRHINETLPREQDDLDSFQNLDLEEEDLVSLEEEVCTIDPVHENITHYSGEFSYWNFSMRLKRHIDDRVSATMFQPASRSDEISGYWRAEKVQSGLSNLSTIVVSCFPPCHVADFLVDVFFEYAQTNYFLVDKTWSLDKINLFYSEPEKLSTKDAPAISVVLTIFAIGTQYVYLDSKQRSQRPKGGMHTFSEDEVGKMFYQQATKLLPEIIELSSLESVQACLLFGVYALSLDASGLAYIYLNLTIRLAMQDGTHRRYTGNPLSASTIEVRNRVWWSAYTLDRKINIFHGRPLSVSRSDVEADLPTGLGSTGSNPTASTTSYMAISIRLVYYLEEFLHHMSSLRTLPKQEISRTLFRLMDTKEAMTTWWQYLAKETINPDISEGALNWRAAMHTRLQYCLTVIRRLIKLEHQNHQKHPFRRLELVNDCVQAALEALDICQSLSQNIGLARASYTEYGSCRASLLVLIAFSIQDETYQFHTSLQRGLDMIYEMSAAGDSARSEVSLIEFLERAMSRLKMLYSNTPGQNPALTLAGRYESFKCWESMWQMANNNNLNNNINVNVNNDNNHGNSYNEGGPQITSTAVLGHSTSPAELSTQTGHILSQDFTNIDTLNSQPSSHVPIPNDAAPTALEPFGSIYSAIDLDLLWDQYH